jgi:hypothetical protein
MKSRVCAPSSSMSSAQDVFGALLNAFFQQIEAYNVNQYLSRRFDHGVALK